MRCVWVTLLFLATVLLALATCQQSGHSTCPCLKTSKFVLRRENIRSYMIQRADVCHINAILFKTVRGFTICSEPQLPWVKKAMQFVDEKAAAINITPRSMNSASTTSTELFEFINEDLSNSANPQNLWVKTVMQFVDEKAATEMTAHPINSISTFKTESTLKTTTHWNGQDEPTTSPELIEFKNICQYRV